MTDLLEEARKRGMLAPEDDGLLAEAQARGLIRPSGVPIGTGRPKQTLSPEGGRKSPPSLSPIPISTDPEGNPYFDPEGGIYGMINELGNSLARLGEASPADMGAVPGVPINPATARDMFNAATVATPINPAVRAGDLAIPGAKTSMVRRVPTPEQGMRAGVAGFEKARGMDVDFAPAAVDNLSRNIEANLNDRGLPAELAPATHSILRKLQSPPDEAVATTGNNIIALRQSFQNIADANAREATKDYAAAVSAIRALDEFIQRPGREGVISGPADAFARTYQKARANVAAASRAKLLARKELQAENRAAAAGSGQNLGNTLRQRAADLLNNPDLIRGWSEAEQAALQFINRRGGKVGANLTRRASNTLAGGGGVVQGLLSGALGTAGWHVGGPAGMAAGAALPIAAGSGTRALYNNMVRNAVQRLEQQLMMRSPLYEQLPATVARNPKALTRVLKALLLLPNEPAATMEPKQ